MYVMYVCMSVCLSGCLPACLTVCMYVCMYLFMYLCMYVCMYVCMSCFYMLNIYIYATPPQRSTFLCFLVILFVLLQTALEDGPSWRIWRWLNICSKHRWPGKRSIVKEKEFDWHGYTKWTCTDIFFRATKKTAQKCRPYFWTKSFRRCCTRSPVLDQRSWPRIQYSYWALRMRAHKALEPARTFWLTWRRSFKKRQARSMCCVPAFTFKVFPFGSLWFTTLTYCGDLHWVFFPHGDSVFFLQWTTASWSTPFTLAL